MNMNKPIRKTPKKIQKVEANYDNGKPMCTCGSSEFSSIRDYDISPDDKKDIGKYKFVVNCLACGCQVTYYINM